MREHQDLWDDWLRTGSSRDMNRLVEAYLPLVRSAVTHTVVKRWGAKTPVEEFMTVASMALVDAIETYDPTIGTPFDAFVRQKVRWALLEEARRSDWVSKYTRRDVKHYLRTVEKLTGRLGRAPTDVEVREQMGLTVTQFRRVQAGIAPAEIVLSIDEFPHDGGYETGGGDTDVGVDDRVVDSDYVAGLRDRVAEALVSLSGPELVVAQLVYGEGVSMRGVAEMLGVSTSTVSKTHTRAIEQMQQFLGLKSSVDRLL